MCIRDRGRGDTPGDRILLSRPRGHQGPRHPRRRRCLRGGGPRLHRCLGEDERGRGAPARRAPSLPRPRVDTRRHSRGDRPPAPQERHRLARGTDSRPDRRPRAPPRVRRLDATPGISRRGVRRQRRPGERTRPSRRRLPPLRGGRPGPRTPHRLPRDVGIPEAGRRPQLPLPPLLSMGSGLDFLL